MEFSWWILEHGSEFEKNVLEWCLDNIVPWTIVKTRPRDWLVITYEELVLSPERSLQLIADRLGLRHLERLRQVMNRPSASTHSSRVKLVRNSDPESLVQAWRSSVSAEMETQVHAIIQEFGINAYECGSYVARDEFLHFLETPRLKNSHWGQAPEDRLVSSPLAPQQLITSPMGGVSNSNVTFMERIATVAAARGTITIIDQAVASATNFATSVIIGRACSKDELGFYMLGVYDHAVCDGMQQALILSPYIVFSARRPGSRFGGTREVSDPPIGPVQRHRPGTRSCQFHTAFVRNSQRLDAIIWALAAVMPFDSASRVCTPGKLRAFAGGCGPLAGLLCFRRADGRFAVAGAFRGTLVEPGILVDRRGVWRDLAGVAVLVATRVCLFARPGPS